MVDMNIETPATTLAKWIGELLVGFAENTVLRVLEGFAIVVALSMIARWLACYIRRGCCHEHSSRDTNSDSGSRFSYPSSGEG
jgi:hypothetical protein